MGSAFISRPGKQKIRNTTKDLKVSVMSVDKFCSVSVEIHLKACFSTNAEKGFFDLLQEL